MGLLNAYAHTFGDGLSVQDQGREDQEAGAHGDDDRLNGDDDEVGQHESRLALLDAVQEHVANAEADEGADAAAKVHSDELGDGGEAGAHHAHDGQDPASLFEAASAATRLHSEAHNRDDYWRFPLFEVWIYETNSSQERAVGRCLSDEVCVSVDATYEKLGRDG